MNQRERRVKLEKIASLDDIHIQVMYYRCIGKKVPQITDILKLDNEGTIWTRFTKIFEKLEIKGADELAIEYCPIFQEFIKSEDDWKNWGNIRSEILRQAWALPSQSEPGGLAESELTKTEGEATPNEPKPPPPTPPSPQPTGSQESAGGIGEARIGRPLPWPMVAIPLLILCLLCIAGVLIGVPIIRNMFGGEATTAQTTQTAALQVPTSIASIVQNTPTTEPLVPTVTFTTVPTDTPLPTFTPTITLTHTPTLTPTNTSTPYPAGFTFLDDFEDGLDPAWKVVFGKYVIANGQLASSEPTMLSLGDSSWKNYEIEFDIFKVPFFVCGADQNANALGVRARDIDNMILYVYGRCETEWKYIIDGNWTPIPETHSGQLNNPTHYIITVEGNKITMHNRSELISSFIDNDFPSGYIYLKIVKDTIYDNFQITFLNP